MVLMLNMIFINYSHFSYAENWELVKSIVGTKFRRNHVVYILKQEKVIYYTGSVTASG